MPEWVSAVVPIKPTFVAGPLVTNKFFRSIGSLGLFAYSGEFWGGLILVVKDFSMSSDFSRLFFPKLEPSHCLLKGCEACLIGHF